MIFVVFFLGMFIGVGAGYGAAVIGQTTLEQRYKQHGLAKVDGEFYMITKIDINEEKKDD